MQQAVKNKRVKTVFQNKGSCLARFAKQSQPHGIYKCKSRQGGGLTPVYFYDNVCYSYGSHYVLAVITEINGVKTGIVNFKKYSNSTTQQSWSVACELAKTMQVIHVDGIEGTEPLLLLETVRNSLEKQAVELETRLFVASFNNVYYVSGIRQDIKSHNRLCIALKFPELQAAFCREVYSQAIKLENINVRARLDRNTRSQDFLCGMIIPYRDRRAMHRKTA